MKYKITYIGKEILVYQNNEVFLKVKLKRNFWNKLYFNFFLQDSLMAKATYYRWLSVSKTDVTIWNSKYGYFKDLVFYSGEDKYWIELGNIYKEKFAELFKNGNSIGSVYKRNILIGSPTDFEVNITSVEENDIALVILSILQIPNTQMHY